MSDPERELAAELGILKDYGGGRELAARTTYLLDRNGIVLHVWDVDDVDAHADEVLAEARRIAG